MKEIKVRPGEDKITAMYRMANAADVAKEITSLHGKLVGYMKKSVALIYEIGQRLTEVKEKLDHGEFTPWVEQHCPFNPRTARNYMAVFERFKTETVSVLEDKTIAEAYIEAGVKKLAAPEGEEEEQPVVHTARDEVFEQARLDALLRTKPLAADLKRYRVLAAGDGEIRYVHPGCATPLPVAHVYVSPQTKAAMAPAYQALNNELQAAFERYFFQVETAEDSGALEKPADTRLSVAREKMRKGRGKAIDATFEDVATNAGFGKEAIS